MRRCSIALFAVLGSLASALAQQQGGPDLMVRANQQVCARACAAQNKQCEEKERASQPVCDTRYIGCYIDCTGCVGQFGRCMRQADADAKACNDAFIACARTSLQARRDDRKPIRFTGGDGSSRQAAIVIDGARNEVEGINAENLWVLKHQPGWRKAHQSLIQAGSRAFDAIEYEAPDGKHTLWFDITSFFGKM